jgi:hypothetical protein
VLTPGSVLHARSSPLLHAATTHELVMHARANARRTKAYLTRWHRHPAEMKRQVGYVTVPPLAAEQQPSSN